MEQIVGELLNAGKNAVVKRYKEKSGIEEKLLDIELLVLKIHSTIELSEEDRRLTRRKRHLHAWRRKLMNIAKEGQDVLREFKDRDANHRGGEGGAESSSSSYSSSPWNIGKRIKRWISGDEDVKKLNETIAMLQRASADTKEFCEVLKWRMPHGIALKREKVMYSDVLTPASDSKVGEGEGQREEEEEEEENVRWFSGVQISRGMQYHMRGCFHAVISRVRRVISGNQKTRTRVDQLLTRLSSAIELGEKHCNGHHSPWLLSWLAKMREAVTQGRNALDTKETYPNRNKNNYHALAERLERMVVDWEAFLDLQVG